MKPEPNQVEDCRKMILQRNNPHTKLYFSQKNKCGKFWNEFRMYFHLKLITTSSRS